MDVVRRTWLTFKNIFTANHRKRSCDAKSGVRLKKNARFWILTKFRLYPQVNFGTNIFLINFKSIFHCVFTLLTSRPITLPLHIASDVDTVTPGETDFAIRWRKRIACDVIERFCWSWLLRTFLKLSLKMPSIFCELVCYNRKLCVIKPISFFSYNTSPNVNKKTTRQQLK